jgi:hypothetical protein
MGIEEGISNIFNEITAENFTTLDKEMSIQYRKLQNTKQS